MVIVEVMKSGGFISSLSQQIWDKEEIKEIKGVKDSNEVFTLSIWEDTVAMS